jgi:hypothetical protein
MSIPMNSESEAQVGPLSGVVTPVVMGDDSYTAMIWWNLLCLAECWDDFGERVAPPSDLEVDFWTCRWMQKKACLPKNVEDVCLSSLFAYAMWFDNPQSMFQVESEQMEYGHLLFHMWCLDYWEPLVALVWSSVESGGSSLFRGFKCEKSIGPGRYVRPGGRIVRFFV